MDYFKSFYYKMCWT